MGLADVWTVLGSLAAGATPVAIVKGLDSWRAHRDARLAAADAAERQDARDDRRDDRRDDTKRMRREERLHDECREDVRRANSRIDALVEENADTRTELARCEERHTAVEERLARLEQRSTPPLPEPAE